MLRGWAVSLRRLILIFPCLFMVGAAQQGSSKPVGESPGYTLPTIVKIDEKRFAELIKPQGKPLLINFWATWCEPCREEFPDLVKIDAEYKGKIDFITISLDFEEDIAAAVPRFLTSMKAAMPTYVLITPDETAAIALVSKEWGGGLPFTVLYEPGGKLAYIRQGLVRHDILQKEIDKLLSPTVSADVQYKKVLGLPRSPLYPGNFQIVDLPLPTRNRLAEDGITDALRDIADGRPSMFVYGLMPGGLLNGIEELQKRYNFGIRGSGCFTPFEGDAYARAYNRTVIAALKKRHGQQITDVLSFANQ